MMVARACGVLALALALAACGGDKDGKPKANPATDPSQVREVPADERGVRLLGVGERAPDFTMEAHDGQTITLSKIDGLVVLYFYPKDETPG